MLIVCVLIVSGYFLVAFCFNAILGFPAIFMLSESLTPLKHKFLDHSMRHSLGWPIVIYKIVSRRRCAKN